MYFWHPFGLLWQSGGMLGLLNLLSYAGVVLLVVGTLMFSPMDLFGVVGKKGVRNSSKNMQEMYTHMRHPFLLGLFLLFLGTPTMTSDRLCLAVLLTTYLYVSSDLQQEDLAYVESVINNIYIHLEKYLKHHWAIVMKSK